MDKCGTTDLFARISRHPDVVPNIKNKETMWWSWERYGKSSVMQWHSRSFLLLLCIDDQTLKQSWRQIFPHWMKENKQRSAFVALFRNLKLIIQLVFSQTHTTMIFFLQIFYWNLLYSTQDKFKRKICTIVLWLMLWISCLSEETGHRFCVIWIVYTWWY